MCVFSQITTDGGQFLFYRTAMDRILDLVAGQTTTLYYLVGPDDMSLVGHSDVPLMLILAVAGRARLLKTNDVVS